MKTAYVQLLIINRAEKLVHLSLANYRKIHFCPGKTSYWQVVCGVTFWPFAFWGDPISVGLHLH